MMKYKNKEIQITRKKGRQKDRKTKDIMTERLKDRKTESHKNREKEKQKDGKTKIRR